MLFDGVVRGIAELHPLDAAGRRAEAAFSVEPGWQGRGIGTRLVARLLEDAVASGYDKIFLCCEVRNRSIRNIAGRFGGSVLFAEGEFAEGECVISFPKASRDSTGLRRLRHLRSRQPACAGCAILLSGLGIRNGRHGLAEIAATTGFADQAACRGGFGALTVFRRLSL
jgi:hypothetical protein